MTCPKFCQREGYDAGFLVPHRKKYCACFDVLDQTKPLTIPFAAQYLKPLPKPEPQVDERE